MRYVPEMAMSEEDDLRIASAQLVRTLTPFESVLPDL